MKRSTTCLLLILVSSFSDASTVKEYNQLSKKFIINYMADSNKASEVAFKQLEIDPSDSTALLRLSLVVNTKQCTEIKSYYKEYGSEDEIRDIARSILKKRCHY